MYFGNLLFTSHVLHVSNRRTREMRNRTIIRKLPLIIIFQGLISIVGPPTNIYPSTNFYLMTRRPFNNTIERMEWQAKRNFLFQHFFKNIPIPPNQEKLYIGEIIHQTSIRSYLSTIFTYNCHLNFHFLYSRSGNSFYEVTIIFCENFHFFLKESGNLSGN